MIEEALHQPADSETNAMQQVDIEFPLRDPMAFLDYTTLVLSCVGNAAELELVLEHFCQDEILQYVDQHSDDLTILGTVFIATLQRVVYDSRDGPFPYGALVIPTLFRRWGWQLEISDAWRNIHYQLLERLEPLQMGDGAFWPTLSRLLLLDALANGTEAAQTKLRARLIKASPCREETHTALQLGQVIGQLGW